MIMKPLGTITMYNRFVDKEIASVTERIMDHATNYYDFVLRLSEKACQNETPTELAYIAAANAWRLSATPAKNMLLQRFNDNPWIRSWTSPHHKIGFERSFADINQAISEAKENWIRIELLCLKAWWARYQMADETYWEEPIGQAESLLRSHSDLECFGALVNTVRSEASFIQRAYERAYESHNQGMEYAKKFDDKYQIYQLLWTRASWVKTWDTTKALELQEA
ncbi:MAG: hypothetical protein ACFFAY_04665, partial [Promethearchaeota archaeon]